ncbi:MAG: polymer-forming cytoskeletal protein [Pseudomonadota bacterium]
MFNQKEGVPEGGIDTLIGPETVITGDVRFRGGLHVDGKVEGSVTSDGDGLLVISDQGTVAGTIEVSTVIVDGTVDGDIRATEKVELREHARMTGNIRYSSIQMAFGAQVNGELACETSAAKSAPAKPAGKAAEPSR